MFQVRRVVGESMSPGYRPDDIVVAIRRRGSVGDVVIAQQKGREVIKRVASVSESGAYLIGDDLAQSKDSRHYGPVADAAIIGVVMIHFPSAVAPPEPRSEKATMFSIFAGFIMTLLALAHLFRIDTLLPILDNVLPGGIGSATVIGALLLTAEVFAVPYLLRMRLSPLGHVMSGLFALFVPLVWVLIAIWTYGINVSIGLLGEFASTPSTWFVLLLCLTWLALNSYTLWSTGNYRVKLKTYKGNVNSQS